MIRAHGWMLILGLFACQSPEKGEPANQFDDTAVSVDADGGTPDDSGTPPLPTDDPTWYSFVEPMMKRHCVRCHIDGGLGVGDFRDLDTVNAMADLMLSRIDAGEMPLPVSDPDCRPYRGSGHLYVSQDIRDAFAEWIDSGKPLGDPQNSPSVETIVETLEEADLEIRLLQPYTPTFSDPANPGNEYRCFILDPEREETFFITAMAPLLDQRSMIHHIVMFTKSVSEVSAEEDVPEGYDCIGSGMGDGVSGMLAGWAPGGLPVEFEESAGFRIRPNDRIVLQIHYYQSGPDVVGLSDQTGYAFQTASEVDKEVMMIPVGDFDLSIPAGATAHTEQSEYGPLPLPFDVEILGTFPHMHVLGSGYKMQIYNAEEGLECLVQSDQYDFDNQQMYMFEEPAILGLGDTLRFQCTYDNSPSNDDLIHNPPIDTHYGERTDEEMCFFFTLIAY